MATIGANCGAQACTVATLAVVDSAEHIYPLELGPIGYNLLDRVIHGWKRERVV